MISVSEARQMIAEKVQPLPHCYVPLEEAHGRILRRPVLAAEEIPAFDRSAMDGYAIARDDDSERFAVIGEIQPGRAPSFSIGKGQCARIFTGAALPSGASQVLMQEDVRREGEWMIPTQRSDRDFVRHKGEDAAQGAVLLQAGTRLRAGETALLAQVGAIRPSVSPAPRVLHLVTGNELLPPSAQPALGQIRDSNSTLVASLLAENGARLVGQDRCGDDLEALVARIRREPAESWDVLLISGGASVGDYDFGRRALDSLGFVAHFESLNLRPGKPLVFATRGGQSAFVIPGNPVSHFVVFHVAIRAALQRLEAAEITWSLLDALVAGELPERPDPREMYWPAYLAISYGLPTCIPLTWQSSGDLCGLVGANALIQIPANTVIPMGAAAKNLLLRDP